MPCSTHKAISRQTRFEPRKSGLGSYILSTKLGCLSSFLSAAAAAAAAAKLLQSCPTLCDPIDSSPPGSPVQEHWSGLPFPSPMHESEK